MGTFPKECRQNNEKKFGFIVKETINYSQHNDFQRNTPKIFRFFSIPKS